MSRNRTIQLSLRQKLQAAAVFAVLYVLVLLMFWLNSAQDSTELGKLVATAFIVLMVVLALYVYCIKLAKKIIADIKYSILIGITLLIALQLNIFVNDDIIVYARPLMLPAMIITVLVGMQTGLFINSVFMLLLYFFDVYYGGFSYNSPAAVYSLINVLVCGTFAAVDLSVAKRRVDSSVTAFKIGAASVVCAASVYIMFDGPIELIFIVGLAAYLSAYVSLLVYLGILPILEKAFNIVTPYRLIELTDHNRTLLKQLAAVAPGTYNHCLAVSNIAEACALAIGENPQLARAAAYYHDIGKIKNPMYFKENQTTLDDPHEDLTPEVSANIIKRHATDGYNICLEHRLPQAVADICLQHHGTTVIKYFYYQASKFTENKLSMEQFRYPGPKPASKIAAIIMIADAAEAVIRTLTDRSKASVEKEVRAIIDERMELEQFSDCDITMRELYAIIDVVVRTTASYYHERVEYPKLKFSRDKDTAEREGAPITAAATANKVDAGGGDKSLGDGE